MRKVLFSLFIILIAILTLLLFMYVFEPEREEPKLEFPESYDQPIVLTVSFSHFEMFVPENQVFEERIQEPKNEPKLLGEFTLTAYCPCEKCCGKWAKNRPKDESGNTIVIGSTGKRLIAGKSIAVDPKVIPYGTTVLIDGVEYVAEDCGGAIKGNRIDVFFDSHEDALNFGRQKKLVVIGG